MTNKRAWLMSILITLLLVGYALIGMVGADQRIPYGVEVMPWSNSYTAVMVMPCVDPGLLVGGG